MEAIDYVNDSSDKSCWAQQGLDGDVQQLVLQW